MESVSEYKDISGKILSTIYLNNIINLNKRLDWDEYFTTITLLASKRSGCSRLHVG